VPIEHVLDCSANELFVVRVAGNVLGLECLGSIDYAISNLRESLQSVIVLAHTECGAVTAAVDNYLSLTDFGDVGLSHAVRSLIDRILLSVRGSARALNRHLGSIGKGHPRYREWLIQTSVYMNAAVTACDLQREVSAISTKRFPVAYTVYDMAFTRISPLPLNSSTELPDEASFATAPVSSCEFISIADRVVERILAYADTAQ
jgi:carbonic anhydrase